METVPAPPQPHGAWSPRRRLTVVATMVAFLVVGLVIWALSPPPPPTLRPSVVYEAAGIFSQRTCRKYNANVSYSIETPGGNVTIYNATLHYRSGNQSGSVTATVNLTFHTGEEISLTMQVDTCKGITKIAPQTCLTFTVGLNTESKYRVDSQTYTSSQDSTLAEFEVCA